MRQPAGFGLAVGDVETRAQAGLDAADEAGGHRHAARGDHADRGGVAAAEVWMPDQHLDHGGGTPGDGRTLGLHQIQHQPGVEGTQHLGTEQLQRSKSHESRA